MARLSTREVRTIGAFGEVVAEQASVFSTQASVDGLRHGELGLGTRELLLELPGE
jgi:hypothetical protein